MKIKRKNWEEELTLYGTWFWIKARLPRFFITEYKDGTWYGKDGKPYEWHLDDPMRLRDIVVWRLCQSKNKRVQRLGWKLWGKP